MRQLTIIGGGITGLAAAYIAAKAGRKVCLIEGSNKFGGLLNTFPIGGNRLEYFYHHFFSHDAELLWLLEELDLTDQIIWRKTEMGIFRKGRIYGFNSPMDLLKFSPISFWGKLKFSLTTLYLGHFADWEEREDISALDWFYKRAGRKVTEAIWKPLLDIKFGPFSGEVPLAWMIGRLRQRVQSRKRGSDFLGYLDGSLQVLSDALILRLKNMGVELISNAPVEKLLIDNQTLKGIETPKDVFTGGDFLFSIPTVYMPELLRLGAPDLAKKMAKIEYFGAVCVILELRNPLSKFYWLNVADLGFPFGGIIEQTNFISPKKYEGKHIAYLSRYFAHSEKIAQMSNEKISEIMLKYLPKIIPDFDQRDLLNVHVFRTQTAATVCDKFFSKKVPSSRTSVENLYLATMAHVYPDERSANNSIRVAAEACRVLGIDSGFVPDNASLSGQIGF